MTVLYCQRCGKFFEKTIKNKLFTIEGNFVVNLMYKAGDGTRFNLYLCPECLNSFKNWFDEIKIGAPEETESEESNA